MIHAFSASGVLACLAVMSLLADHPAAIIIPEEIDFAYLPLLKYIISIDGISYADSRVTGLQVACLCPIGSTIEIFYNSERIRGPDSCNNIKFHELPNPKSGNYSCHYSTGTISSKILRVINVSVTAPEVQYGLLGTKTTLQCQSTSNLTKSATIWRRNGREVQASLSSITLQDEGVYECDIYFFSIDVQVIRTVQLVVLVPPALVGIHPLPDIFSLNSHSLMGHLRYTSNSHESVSITFNSKPMNDTRIQWYKNDIPINKTAWIYNTLDVTQGETSLNFQLIRHNDSGNYRVEIINTNMHIPLDARYLKVKIAVEVNIQPNAPEPLIYDPVTKLLYWDYQNETEDSFRNSQIVLIKFSKNGSLAQRFTLNGSARYVNLTNLIPATKYKATVTAVYRDANATSLPITFRPKPKGTFMLRLGTWTKLKFALQFWIVKKKN